MRSYQVQKMLLLCENIMELDRMIEAEESALFQREKHLGPDISRRQLVKTAKEQRRHLEETVEGMLDKAGEACGV